MLVTDAPLCARQLKRICRRAGAGLALTGTALGSGSGDLVLGVLNAQSISHDSPDDGHMSHHLLHENQLDLVFRAAIESTQEAILNCLFAAETATGKKGRVRHSLSDYWPDLCR
ncbi:MAG: P1 family peptidase [Cohaesibacter sp.]|nr:P1 family peptidase [Cohaesibacter sp.]